MRPTGRPLVLHVLSCDDWGGTEVQVSTQVLRSAALPTGQAVAILEPPGVVHARLVEAGVEVASVAGAGGPAGAARRLAALVRRLRPRVLEVYGFRASLVARAAIVLAGRPAPRLVIGIRGLHFTEDVREDGRKTRVANAVERLLGPTVARYDCNSFGARDYLAARGFPAGKLVVIPNGVAPDVPRARPDAPGPARVVCVARFIPRKRHDVLLDALARLVVAGRELRCELVGYGVTLERSRALAERLGIADRVEFTGRLTQRETLQRIASAHVFALASAWEGLPGVVLEAMAAGLPVVGTDVNGTREAIVPGQTGLLVPAGDPEALAGALGRLLDDPALRVRMAAAGRRRVEETYAWDRVVNRKAALYAETAAP